MTQIDNDGWQSVDMTPDRQPDALDREMAKIASIAKAINVEAIPLSKNFVKKLRAEFIECIDLSRELHEDDRDYVVEIITEGLLEGSLVDFLRDMIAERQRADRDAKSKEGNI